MKAIVRVKDILYWLRTATVFFSLQAAQIREAITLGNIYSDFYISAMKITNLVFLGVVTPSVVFALWRINVAVTTAALGAIGYACASGAAPACAIAAAAAIIITAMSGINNGDAVGQTGQPTVDPRTLQPIQHFLPNGTVHNYLNTAALEVGVEHIVQTGDVTLRASKHPNGSNRLRASLQPSGPGRLGKRVDPNAIEEIDSYFGDRNWPVQNQWSQDEVNNMASTVINTENLDGETMCSTISDDTDADTFDMSWIFSTGNHYATEIPPPCGSH